MSRITVTFFASLAAVTVACSSDSGGPIEIKIEECKSNLSVSRDSIPVFRWSPSCGSHTLFVQQADSLFFCDGTCSYYGEAVWKIAGGVHSPVTYGVQPAGATVSLDPKPLVKGRSYLVRLSASGFLQRTVYTGQTIFTYNP